MDSKLVTKTLNLDYKVSRSDRWSHVRSFSGDMKISDGLLEILDDVYPNRYFLKEITDSSSIVQLYLQLPGSVNQGETIDSSILQRMGDMGISFGIEVFPDWSET